MPGGADSGPRASGISEARGLLLDALALVASPQQAVRRRREVASALSQVAGHVHAAIASGADAAAFSREVDATRAGAQEALALSRASAGGASAEGTLDRLLSKALEALRDARWQAFGDRGAQREAGAPPLLRATVGEPALLHLERGALPIGVPVPPDPLRPETPPPRPPPVVPPRLTLGDLEAKLARAKAGAEALVGEPTPPKARTKEGRPPAADEEIERVYFGVALTEYEVVFDRARTCLEDLALLGAMRRPLADQPWEGRKVAEQRLLARVDAIAACGEAVLPGLVKQLEAQPVPDPELTWALVFLFGSIAGEDALDQAMVLARVAPLADDAGVLAAVSDALALAPHPGIDGAVRRWLGDPAPERRTAAVRALGRRGSLTAAEALTAARDSDARVAAAGAAALASTPDPVDPAALQELARRGDEAVSRAAMESAFVRRSDVGLRRARELMEEGRPEFGGAAMLVALGDGPEALEPLQRAAAAGSISAVEGLGWYGHPASVELLLGLAERGPAAAAIAALQRITGASLTDADPAPEYEPDSLPFTRPEGPIPPAEILAADADVWRAWWRRHGERARRDQRHRFGHPWRPIDDLEELVYRFSLPHERRLAHLELCVRSGAIAAFDAEGFVARQRRQLAIWSELLSGRRGGTGTWPVRLAR